MPPTPQHLASPLAQAIHAQAETMSSAGNAQRGRSSFGLPSGEQPDKDTYVSKIGILASSMPYYHDQFMEQVKADRLKASGQRSEGEDLEPHEVAYFQNLALDTSPREQSSEEQAATARRLKPHSRSTLQLQYITSQAPQKPEDLKQNPPRKQRTKWQFGIRSRNLPHEAIHCVYKALAAQHAQWEVAKPATTPPAHGPKNYSSDKLPRESVRSEAGKDEDLADDYLYGFNLDSTNGSQLININSKDDDDIDPNAIPENYIPKDPWCIHVRWRKDGMYPPSTIHPSSAHSSHIDLHKQDGRRHSVMGSMSSAATSTTSIGHSSAGPSGTDNACYVYMDVQLYTIEPATDKQAGTYLVDFKCAGYESIVESAVGETAKGLVGSGYRVTDKDVTSPQPFLDLTNKLVIHLAGGG